MPVARGWRCVNRLAFVVCLLSFSCQRPWQVTPRLKQTAIGVEEGIVPDAQAAATIAPYRAQVQEKMKEVIGRAAVSLEKGVGESALGNFVADLMLEQARALTAEKIDLSVVNIGGLRTPIPAGDITVGHIYELMPFENQLVVLTLPGEAVRQLLEYAAARQDAPLGNVTYTIRDKQPHDIRIGGRPLNPNQPYRVVTSDYLALGGDKMTFLKDATASKEVGVTLRDAIIRHIRQLTAKNQPVKATVEGRVKEN